MVKHLPPLALQSLPDGRCASELCGHRPHLIAALAYHIRPARPCRLWQASSVTSRKSQGSVMRWSVGHGRASRDSRMSESELGRMDRLEEVIGDRLEQMDRRVVSLEESLKMRVAQMEIAIMGALRNAHASDPVQSSSHCGDCSPGTSSSFRRGVIGAGSSRTVTRSMCEQNAHGTAQASAAAPDAETEAEEQAYELYKAGQTVHTMQALVEGDAEVRSMVLQLRRQVANAARAEQSMYTRKPTGRMSLSESGMQDASQQESLRRLRTCLALMGPVLHPDSRFRSSWNAAMALLIVYCGVAIPLGEPAVVDLPTDACPHH